MTARNRLVVILVLGSKVANEWRIHRCGWPMPTLENSITFLVTKWLLHGGS
jgi:hypothetical protein